MLLNLGRHFCDWDQLFGTNIILYTIFNDLYTIFYDMLDKRKHTGPQRYWIQLPKMLNTPGMWNRNRQILYRVFQNMPTPAAIVNTIHTYTHHTHIDTHITYTYICLCIHFHRTLNILKIYCVQKCNV